MTCFAAEPGSRLIHVNDEDHDGYAIVGWFHGGDGPGVLPLVVGREGPLVAGDAILADSGRVFDLTTATVYGDAASWREAVAKLDLYRPGLTLPRLAYRSAVGPGTSLAMGPLPTPKVTPSGKPAVDFSGKTFSKTSFWQAPQDLPTVVFILEPGQLSPISGARKITRDEFEKLKKELPEVTPAILSQTEPPPPLLAAMEAPAPKPAVQPAPPPVEDDDADDMI